MIRDYQSRAVDRVFKRNVTQLKHNVNKLIATTGYYTCTRSEVWQEMCVLFHNNFEEYYESDRQYLSFLFICLKNRIRNMQKSQYNREYRYTLDLGNIRASLNIPTNDREHIRNNEYSAVWGQVADPKCGFRDMELKEIVNNAKKLMDQIGRETFNDLLQDGTAIKEVSEVMKLRRIKRPTPAEVRRLRRLERRPFGDNTISEVINVIETSIKPVFDRAELSIVGI